MTVTKTATTTRAAVATDNGNPLAHYAVTLKGWQAKFAGGKPTADNFKLAHQLGARPGTKTAIAIAMMLRDGGATQPQIITVVGGTYLNKQRELIAAGHAVRVPQAASNEGHTVYKLALPAKGKAAAKGKGKAAKPATAKPAKGKAAKPAKADTPPAKADNA